MLRESGIMRGIMRGVSNLSGIYSSGAALMENGVLVTTSGSRVVPPGVTSLDIEGWGAGGNGTEYVSPAPATYFSVGGGAGGYFKRESVAVTPGDTVNFTVNSNQTICGPATANKGDSHNNYNWSQIGSDFSISGSSIGQMGITALSENRIAVASGTIGLRTYDFDGDTWTQVGNTLTIASLAQPVIRALSSTRIIKLDGGTDRLQAYDFDGTDWTPVGNYTTISVVNSSIAVLSPTLIAVRPNTSNITTYSFNGTNWSVVGTAFTGNFSSTTGITALSSDTIALLSPSGTSTFIRAYKWNGSTWSTYKSPTTFRSSGISGLARIIALSPNHVVMFNQTEVSGGVVRMMYLDDTLTQWVELSRAQVDSSVHVNGQVDDMTALSQNKIVVCNPVTGRLRVFQAETGIGGIASGGDINEQGGHGLKGTTTVSGVGGNAYNGGAGGAAANSVSNGNNGSPPGGGGSSAGGATINATTKGLGAAGGIKFSWS